MNTYNRFLSSRAMFAVGDEPTGNVAAAVATMTAKQIPLPPGVATSVPFDKIRRVHNVRPSQAEAINAKRLLPSLIASGYIAAYPMMLHDAGHGVFEILAGHGRFAGLNLATPEQRKKILASTHGKVPAVVFSELTDEQKGAVRAHDFTAASDKMPADKWTEYLIVKDFLLAAKLSDVDVATFMGWINTQGKAKGEPNRNKVLQYRRLHEMSVVAPRLEKEYEKLWNSMLPESERKTPFIDGKMAELHKLFNSDLSGGALNAKIDEFLIAAAITGNADEVKIGPHKLSAKDAKVLALATPCTLAKRLLLAATGQPMGTGGIVERPEDVIADIYALESASIVKRTATSSASNEGNGFDDIAAAPERPAKGHKKSKSAK